MLRTIFIRSLLVVAVLGVGFVGWFNYREVQSSTWSRENKIQTLELRIAELRGEILQSAAYAER